MISDDGALAQPVVSGVVTIVDYGMGNLGSVRNALAYIGVAACIEQSPEKIASSDRIILPGVGSFARAMSNLRSSGLVEALNHAALTRKRPVLGICLGMQLLAEVGTEDGINKGLGWIPGEVVRLEPEKCGKVPHVGFDRVCTKAAEDDLFDGIGKEADFYFVHSYHFVSAESANVTGDCDYGGPVVAAVRTGHIRGVQFHPEKSQANGLRVLRNFCRET